MKTEREKMVVGELYNGMDPELVVERAHTESILRRYNAGESRALPMLFKHWGDKAEVRAPFFCDYGWNISLGDSAFMNFNCVVLDVCEVVIGAGTQIGPGVQIYAADHPRDPAVRREELENGKPVRIGENVWIGGGAIILPGVTVGDDAIIGAGSVVTRDVAAGSTVMGNPARPRVRPHAP